MEMPSMDVQLETAEPLPSVEGVLNFMQPMRNKPREYAYEPPAGVPRSNVTIDPHAVRIRDMRPIAASLSLDREGFTLVAHHSAVADFYDEDALRRVYYPEAEQLIATATGASRVVVFDHTIRRRIEGMADRTPGAPRQPSARVHGDYSDASGIHRLRDVMGAEAEALLQHRFAIINIWRPIRAPLRDAPLAVCDASSLTEGDLVAADLLYRGRAGENYTMVFNPRQRWFYVPDMRVDEVLLLKCYDSAQDGRARFMPHTAFADPTPYAEVRPRESIELRTFAFFAQ
jgi:hypothetical protein